MSTPLTTKVASHSCRNAFCPLCQGDGPVRITLGDVMSALRETDIIESRDEDRLSDFIDGYRMTRENVGIVYGHIASVWPDRCNSDENGCSGGFDGERCRRCQAAHDADEAYFAAQYQARGVLTTDSEYASAMQDAGRGRQL